MKQPFSSLKMALGLAILATLLACAGMGIYARHGERLLRALDNGIGEVLMKEGHRLELAGVNESAKATYRAALKARFAGAQNKAFVQRHLGVMLWKEGRPGEALPLLQAAAAPEEASLAIFEPWCDVLLQLKRSDELKQAAERWRGRLLKEDNPAARALACHYLAQAARLNNSLPEAESLLREGFETYPGGPCAAELALLASERGQTEEARQYAEAFLSSGACGPMAPRMRALYAAAR